MKIGLIKASFILRIIIIIIEKPLASSYSKETSTFSYSTNDLEIKMLEKLTKLIVRNLKNDF